MRRGETVGPGAVSDDREAPNRNLTSRVLHAGALSTVSIRPRDAGRTSTGGGLTVQRLSRVIAGQATGDSSFETVKVQRGDQPDAPSTKDMARGSPDAGFQAV